MTTTSPLDRVLAFLAAPAGGESSGGYLWPRWIFLRALGLIFFSAFYSLAFQIHGLIGARGIAPQGDYLDAACQALPGLARFWELPTLFWLSSSDAALTAVVALGIACSLLLAANVWPRVTTALCTILFLSCITTLQYFSSYQSDGMLLEAGFVACFFAPRGLRPGLGASDPPSRISLFMLRWEWFRIYFESGIVKLASGDPHWRNLTAMDQYYQNGPLPAWPGWYVQQLPHWYHAGTALLTLVVEWIVVWAVWLPRRVRLACFVVVTALQLGIIATANYAFLNYLVLMLGVLLLDDRPLTRPLARSLARLRLPRPAPAAVVPRPAWASAATAALFAWTVSASVIEFLGPASGRLRAPADALDPFRVASAYGLFATMTDARYEIEFQGSADGRTWVAYPFRYKPQNPMERPGIYAPYQPRFEWNLWFASLAPWQDSPWVVSTQARLVEGSPSVLRLFRGDPFHGHPPPMVRTVKWQYWFTDLATRRATGAWWRRTNLGVFAGVVSRSADGQLVFTPAAP